MLIVGSALKGYTVDANDGRIGTVKNFLFDDTTWKLRWLVIDTGNWLSGRQVLVHPSAIGVPDHEQQHLPVGLTKAQVEASPDILQDQPVSMQMQSRLYDYYGWDPYWGPNFFGSSSVGLGSFSTFTPPVPYWGGAAVREAEPMPLGIEDGDRHLRSMTAVRGYHIHATDGSIGHVENFLIDDASWTIHYLIVDTRNWWPGARVLIAPHAVQDIDWGEHQIHLNVTQDQVKTSPRWDPVDVVGRVYQQQLHDHYGWPGFGW